MASACQTEDEHVVKGTQIVIRSPERTEYGFPRRLCVYLVGEARSIGAGSYFNVCVEVLRENDLHLPRPPLYVLAQGADTAREIVISYYDELARQLRLDISITDISETGEQQARSATSPGPSPGMPPILPRVGAG